MKYEYKEVTYECKKCKHQFKVSTDFALQVRCSKCNGEVKEVKK